MFEGIRYCSLMYFPNMCLKRCELVLARFLTAPRLAWQADLKVKLDLIIDTDMLLMVEKGIRVGIFHTAQ